MSYDATCRRNWKARIARTVKKLPAHISKPQHKLVTEVLTGMLLSGSAVLADIGRALGEPVDLHQTEKRLSRMLGQHGHLARIVRDLALERMRGFITPKMVIGIDPGDLNRDGSSKSEWISLVHDGSTGGIVNGYPLMSVVARDPKTRRDYPLYVKLYSPEETDHESQNAEVIAAMRQVRAQVPHDCLWAMDCGGDAGVFWKFWLKEKFRIVVRADNKRHWAWRGRKMFAQDIAKQVPCKHKGQIGRGKKKREVAFGITKVRLPAYMDRQLWMIVVRHGKLQPMVLVTTCPVRGRSQGQTMIDAYLERWACEDGYRFLKQGFNLEQMQVRNFNAIRNLVAIAGLAWVLLARYQAKAPELLHKARRLKKKADSRRPFYALLDGLKALFAGIKDIFYSVLRKPWPPDMPLIPGLFKVRAI
ncbi:MAG: transposase [Pseudomonadota bacterium]|nr:transposase [Pseudomonadota bacterium]